MKSNNAIKAVACATALWASTMLLAQEAPPATQPATTQPMAGNVDQLRNDIDMQYGLLQDVLDSADTLTTPARRSAAAPQVIPGLKKIVADLDALTKADPEHLNDITGIRSEYLMWLTLFGDSQGADRLAAEASSADPAQSLRGKVFQIVVSWTTSAQNADAQGAIADQIEKLAKDNPGSEELAVQMYHMSRVGPASPELAKRVTGILTGTMKGDVVDAIKSQMEGDQKMALALENKPLTISGTKPDGTKFTTADWKGKVILVDFWATWCGPCLGELPHVKKMYAAYHGKGLEILGVSNDMSAEALTKFLSDKPDMPWPQLFDAAAAAKQQWNPITTGFGINGIPTMFLIDKKGVLRSVTARENMDDLIPKLLAE
jgi:thiol-disulfide isomerase/thioredoxin